MTETTESPANPISPFGYDWIANLLAVLERDLPAETRAAVLQSCAAAHYREAGMDAIIAGYQNNLEGFLHFLHNTWGWRITYDRAAGTILADEAKSECVCPIVRHSSQPVPTLLCHCSEGMAERMFSVVIGKPVKAKVVRSILRGAESCVYAITINAEES